MNPHDKLYRGEIYCAICLNQEKPHRRKVSMLVSTGKGTYEGRCWTHQKDEDYNRVSMLEQCFHVPWRDVVKLTIHKTDEKSYDRTGKVITVEMRDVPNIELMRNHAIEVCHALQLMADKRATIHEYTRGTEQNGCWTENNYMSMSPAAAYVRDKYWGFERIKSFRKICRVMAEVHGWELTDETECILDRMARAVDQ